ncbi:MAG: hypothetical protein P4L16_02995 [Chlamydiales bacterium]|nr:hypothetical protein [Chlamydiales bacterium]
MTSASEPGTSGVHHPTYSGIFRHPSGKIVVWKFETKAIGPNGTLIPGPEALHTVTYNHEVLNPAIREAITPILEHSVRDTLTSGTTITYNFSGHTIKRDGSPTSTEHRTPEEIERAQSNIRRVEEVCRQQWAPLCRVVTTEIRDDPEMQRLHDRFNSDLERLRTDYQSQSDSQISRIHNLEEQLSRAQGDNNSLREQLTQAHAERDRINSEFQQQLTDLQRRLQDSSQDSQQIQNLQQRLQELQLELNQTQTDSQGQLRRLETQLSQKDSDLQTTQHEKADLERQLQQNRADLQQATRAKGELQRQLNEASQNNTFSQEHLQTRINGLLEDIRLHGRAIERLQNRISFLNGQISTLEQEKNQLIIENTQLFSRNVDLQMSLAGSRKANEALKQRIQLLESEATSAEAEARKTKSALTRLENEHLIRSAGLASALDLLRANATTLGQNNRTIDDLLGQIRDLELSHEFEEMLFIQEKEQLNTQLENARMHAAELETVLSDLRTAHAERTQQLETELAHAREETHVFEERTRTSEAQLAAATREFQAKETDFQQRIENLERDLAAARHEKASVTEELQRVQAERGSLISSLSSSLHIAEQNTPTEWIETALHEVEEKDNRITALTTQVQKQERRLADLEESIATVQRERNDLFRQLQEKTQEFETAQRDNSALQAQHIQDEDKIHDLERDLEANRNQYQTLQQQQTGLTQQLEDIQRENRILNTQLDGLNSRFTLSNRANASLERTIQGQQELLHANEAHIERLQRESAEKSEQISNLITTRIDIAKQLVKLRQDHDALLETHTLTAQELGTLREDHARAETLLQEMQADNERLRTHNASLQRSLQEQEVRLNERITSLIQELTSLQATTTTNTREQEGRIQQLEETLQHLQQQLSLLTRQSEQTQASERTTTETIRTLEDSLRVSQGLLQQKELELREALLQNAQQEQTIGGLRAQLGQTQSEILQTAQDIMQVRQEAESARSRLTEEFNVRKALLETELQEQRSAAAQQALEQLRTIAAHLGATPTRESIPETTEALVQYTLDEIRRLQAAVASANEQARASSIASSEESTKLQADLEDSMVFIGEQDEEITKLTQELSENNRVSITELSAARALNKGLAAQIDRLEREASTRQEELDTLSTRLRSALERIERQEVTLRERDAQIEELTAQREALYGQFNAVTAEKEQVLTKQSQILAGLERAQDEQQRILSTISRATEDLNNAESLGESPAEEILQRITRLQQRKDELTTTIDDLTQADAIQKRELATLEERITNLEAERTRLQERIRAYQQENQELRVNLHETQEQNTRLTSSNIGLQSNLDAAQTSLERLHRAVTLSSNEKERMQEFITKLESTTATLEQEQTALHSRLAEVQSQNQDSTTQITALRNENEELEQAKNAVTARLQEATTRLIGFLDNVQAQLGAFPIERRPEDRIETHIDRSQNIILDQAQALLNKMHRLSDADERLTQKLDELAIAKAQIEQQAKQIEHLNMQSAEQATKLSSGQAEKRELDTQIRKKDHEINQLTTKNTVSNARAQVRESDLKQMRSVVASLEEQLGNALRAKRELEERIARTPTNEPSAFRLQEERQRNQVAIQELTQATREKQALLDELQKQHNELKLEHDTVKNQLDTEKLRHREDVTQLEERIRQSDSSLKETNARYARFTAKSATDLSNAKANTQLEREQKEEAINRLNMLSETFKETQEYLAKSNQSKQAIRDELTEAQIEIQRANRTIEQRGKDLVEAQTRLQETETLLEATKTELREIEVKQEEAQIQLKNFEERIHDAVESPRRISTELAQHIESLKSKLTSKTEEIEKLKESATKHNHTIIQLNREKHELEQRNSKAEQKLRSLEVQFESSQQRVQSLEEQNTKQQSDLLDQQQMLTEKDNQLIAKESILVSTQAKNQELEEKNGLLDFTKKQLSEDNDRLITKNQDLEKQLALMKVQLEQANQRAQRVESAELNEMHGKLESAHQEIERAKAIRAHDLEAIENSGLVEPSLQQPAESQKDATRSEFINSSITTIRDQQSHIQQLERKLENISPASTSASPPFSPISALSTLPADSSVSWEAAGATIDTCLIELQMVLNTITSTILAHPHNELQLRAAIAKNVLDEEATPTKTLKQAVNEVSFLNLLRNFDSKFLEEARQGVSRAEYRSQHDLTDTSYGYFSQLIIGLRSQISPAAGQTQIKLQSQTVAKLIKLLIHVNRLIQEHPGYEIKEEERFFIQHTCVEWLNKRIKEFKTLIPKSS